MSTPGEVLRLASSLRMTELRDRRIFAGTLQVATYILHPATSFCALTLRENYFPRRTADVTAIVRLNQPRRTSTHVIRAFFRNPFQPR